MEAKVKKVNCTLFMVVQDGELIAGYEDGPLVSDKKADANKLLKTLPNDEGEGYRVAKVKCIEVTYPVK